MMRTKSMLGFAGRALLLMLLVPSSGTFAAENRNLENVRRVLEASTFPRAAQVEVNTRAAAAINAGVPSEDVEIIVSRAVARGADAGAINRFLDTGMSVKKEGLPVRPLLDRIEQGLSKGVQIERIAAASRRLAEKITAAQPLVDTLIRNGMTSRRGNEREAAIASAARALEKSMNARDIEAMGASVRTKGGSLMLFTSAMDTATYFAASGVSPKTAMRLVRDAVEKGSSERDLGAMVRRMDDEMKRGAGAEDAATKMERGDMRGEHGMERGMDRQDMRQEMKIDHGGIGSGNGKGGHGR
jgi:hypothetical protein